jgi:hypothetical protein
MGNSGSVPAEYLQAWVADGIVMQHLQIQQTIKYNYSNSGYSLSQKDKRGALIITTASLIIFRSRKLVLDIKFDDPRWKTGEISGSYDNSDNTLHITLSTKTFHAEIGRLLRNEPSSYVDGVVIFSFQAVELPQPVIARIFEYKNS